MMRAMVIAAALAAGSTGCHFYFGDDDDGDADAGFVDWDAAPPPVVDAAAPDAPPCVTVDAFLERFGACMAFADWQAAGMCAVPSQPTPLGQCNSCHADGTGGVLLSERCEATFDATRTRPYVLGLVRPVDDGAGCFRGFSSGSWLATEGSDRHSPTYTFSPERRQAIATFLDLAFAKYNDPAFDCSAQ
ncbi:MAG: hypothetical protein D6689_18030 [Deltaproteobacteria bacterium]|nr:MAG: hypothetical protein D6689_18030 [Deltaproteobacteria bacterium]